MLRLNHIKLTQYKNYTSGQFQFPKNVIGICGLNGIGKTNLLDAIHYCCFTKSYFSTSDIQNIQHSKDGFRLEAGFIRQEKNADVVCINRGNKKEFSLNGTPYTKFSKHIGYLPVVMIAPDDIDLITGSGETRRKFLDTVLSQVDAEYLQQLIHYNKLLAQRNSLLKNYQGGNDQQVLEVIDSQLAPPGTILFEKRKLFLDELIPQVNKFYDLISGGKETIRIEYLSQLHGKEYAGLLQNSLSNDLYLQRTTQGIHKDDISFLLGDSFFKQAASQGQRKSLLFALKLAEYEVIKGHKGFAPILLLDDVFEKLDAERMQNLLMWVCSNNPGQVFITDTHCSRLEQSFSQLNIDGTIISL